MFWLVINLVQAGFTELTSDEGYYWLYAQHLQWGYYDHPPMLALLIKAGYYFAHNEFGVRAINVILNAWAILIFFNLLPPGIRNRSYTYIFLLSLPLLNYLSFIVFPDGPLLFFCAAFLWCYKRFIAGNDLIMTLLLGVIISMMLYSKYHGVLVVAFTVLSNFKLLKNKNFYISLFIAALLFIPHLLWQYNNDFITFRYHLYQREAASSSNRVFEYISQQLVAIGPGLVFIPFVYKVKDQFEKTLLYLIVGTFGFFLIVSINTFVHFHWTSIAIFPLLYLAIKYYHNKSRKIIMWLLIPFCIIIFLFRLQLLFPLFPVNHVGVDYYHGRKIWAKEIHSLAGNSPVIFENDFRESSLYSFYSGKMGLALFSGRDRKTQYDLWNYEDSIQNKNALLIKNDSFPGSKLFHNNLSKRSYYIGVPQLHSFYNIPVHVNFPAVIDSNHNCIINITIVNSRKQPLNFDKHKPAEKTILFCSIEGQNTITDLDLISLDSLDVIPEGNTKSIVINLPTATLGKGKYKVLFGFRNPPLQNSFNATYNFVVR